MKIDSISSGVIKMQDARIAHNTENISRAESVNLVNDVKRTDVEQGEVINDEMLESSVKQANKALEQYNRMIERTIHEKTHTIIYVLKDTVTNEVIREFPPRKIQDMIAKMWEMAGILIDERR